MKPHPRRTLVITDNSAIHQALQALITRLELQDIVSIRCSPKGPSELKKILRPVDLKSETDQITREFELVISAHCKQIFPASLHNLRECINIHPGHNPDTRGWYPQVWAILHGLPLGFTVHRIDDQLDHGAIIDRQELPLHPWDTSFSAYQRVLQAEIDWLQQNLLQLLNGDYTTTPMQGTGNLFLRRDFNALLEINLQKTGTWEEFVRHLRSVSFQGYRNAWFRDPKTGQKIHIQITLDPDSANMRDEVALEMNNDRTVDITVPTVPPNRKP